MKKYSTSTEVSLWHAKIEDISVFQNMTVSELREKYPRTSFDGKFFEDMMNEGYFLNDEMGPLLRSFEMSSRLRNILDRYEIVFIPDLTYYAYEDYSKFRNFGKTMLEELNELCKRLDVKLISHEWIKGNMLGVHFDMWELSRMFRNKIYYPEDFLNMSEEVEKKLLENDDKMPKKIATVLKRLEQNKN